MYPAFTQPASRPASASLEILARSIDPDRGSDSQPSRSSGIAPCCAARAAELSFRELYENISEGVFRSTLDGRMISANPALVRLNGYETEEELIRNCNDIATEWYVDPNRRAEIHQMLLKDGQRHRRRLGNLPSQYARADLDRGERPAGARQDDRRAALL